MNLTRRQKQLIRDHFHGIFKVRILKTGVVMGENGTSWSVIYTPEQTRKHLKALGLPVY